MTNRFHSFTAVLVLGTIALASGAAEAQKGVSLNDLKAHRKPAPAAKKPTPKPAPRKPVAPARAVRTPPKATSKPVAQKPVPAKQVTLVVAQVGPGQFRTLGEAVQKAPLGARLLVHAGTYRESLTLARPVEIAPAEPGEQVTLESPSGPCLTLLAEATVRGLTVQARDGVEYPVVVTRGKAMLEGCEITAGSAGCVRVTGEQSAPVLKKCRLRRGDEQALLLEARAHAMLDDCTLSGAALGMVVTGGSEATLRNCQLFENEEGGIQFKEQSRGGLEACELRGNGGTAVEILSNSSPTLRKTRVHHGTHGVSVAGKSQPLIDDCDVFANSQTGISVSGESQPIIRQSRIYDQKRTGLAFAAQAGGSVLDSEVRGSVDAPCVTVRDGSTPRFQRCIIRDARKRGLQVENGGAPLLEECEIRNNGDFNVHISLNARGVLRNCKLHDAGGASVVIETGAAPLLEGCSIYGSTEGVYIWGKATPTLTQCRIYENTKEGAKFERDGLGTFENCDIYDNGEAGVWMVNAANPTFRRCRIIDGRSLGVFVGPRGLGQFEACRITGNRVGNVNSVEAGRPLLRDCRVE